MKKRFLSCVSVGMLCLMAMPALADCVCGTTGCKPCEDTEDYLEDVGEHMKKQSKRLHKRMNKAQNKGADVMSNCKAGMADFWMEEAEVLDKNGNVILYYAELVEDDAFVLTPAQKAQAKTDAAALKQAGEKVKAKASAAREECMQVTEVVEEEVVEMPTATKMMKTSKKTKKMHQPKGAQSQMMWLDAMEQNGNMLVEVGDFIDENMTK